MRDNNLTVSECFYSIQGEGQTMGKLAVFLRLAGCNLLCKSSSWTCDSIEVWQKGVKTNFKDVLSDYFIIKLKEGAHLVITGGEPLLHQKKIVDFIHWFMREYNFCPVIEVETNGTIVPIPNLASIVDFWNVSPKLKNSGESYNKRINSEALLFFNKTIKKTIFKFVISESSDVDSMLNEYRNIINTTKIVLMAAGENQTQLAETREMVVQQCLIFGFNYSERLHIVIWNKKTGV